MDSECVARCKELTLAWTQGRNIIIDNEVCFVVKILIVIFIITVIVVVAILVVLAVDVNL